MIVEGKDLKQFLDKNDGRNYDGYKNLPSVIKSFFVTRGRNIPITDLDIPNSHPTFNFIKLLQTCLELTKEYKTYYKISMKASNRKVFENTRLRIEVSPKEGRIEIRKHENEEGGLERKGISKGNIGYVAQVIDLLQLIEELEFIVSLCIQGLYYEYFVPDSYSLPDKFKGKKYHADFPISLVSYLDREESKKGFLKLFQGETEYWGSDNKHWSKFQYRFPETGKFWKTIFKYNENQVRLTKNNTNRYAIDIIKMESSIKYRLIEHISRMKDPKSKYLFGNMHDGFNVRSDKAEVLKSQFKIVVRKYFKELGIEIDGKVPTINLEAKAFKHQGLHEFHLAVFACLNSHQLGKNVEYLTERPVSHCWARFEGVFGKAISKEEKQRIRKLKDNDHYFSGVFIKTYRRTIYINKDRTSMVRKAYSYHPDTFIIAKLILDSGYNAVDFKRKFREFLG